MKRKQVVILAGGLATRLGSLTEKTPKSMLKIAEQPFIAHQLENLKKQGIERVLICAGHLGEQLEKFLGNGENFGLSINYSFDGSTQLGTGGAIANASALLDENFFVMYGDSYLVTQWNKIDSAFDDIGKPALMAIFKNFGKWDVSNVQFIGNDLIEYNKTSPSKSMDFVDYGLSIFSKNFFVNHPFNNNFDLSELLQSLSCSRSLAGIEVKERFFEIGSLSGINETENFIKSRHSNDKLY